MRFLICFSKFYKVDEVLLVQEIKVFYVIKLEVKYYD